MGKLGIRDNSALAEGLSLYIATGSGEVYGDCTYENECIAESPSGRDNWVASDFGTASRNEARAALFALMGPTGVLE